MPIDKKFERGDIQCSGYKIDAVEGDDTKCNVTFLIQCDPRGWLPKVLVNIDAPKELQILTRIKLLVEKGEKTFNK